MPNKPSIAIVYVSIHHGNTRNLAESLATELSADLFTVDQAGTVNFQQYDLVGFGSSPSSGGRMILTVFGGASVSMAH